MPAYKRVTNAQILNLLDYLEKHRDIKLGTATPEDKHTEYKHWEKITETLNNIPGDTKNVAKWKSYWNDLKWRSRRKVADKIPLNDIDNRVLDLAGRVSNYPVAVSVIPRGSEMAEPEENQSEEKSDDVGEEEMEWNMVNSTLPENRDHDYPATDPMPVMPMLTVKFGKVENCPFEQDQEDDAEINANTAEASPSDVPEWVRRVEQSRLALEERSTRAIEQMSSGIASISESMRSIAGSLHAIEASIRDLKNKN